MAGTRKPTPWYSLFAAFMMLPVAGLLFVNYRHSIVEDRLLSTYEAFIAAKKGLMDVETQIGLARVNERQLNTNHNPRYIDEVETALTAAKAATAELLAARGPDNPLSLSLQAVSGQIDAYRASVRALVRIQKKMGLSGDSGYQVELWDIEQRLHSKIHDVHDPALDHALMQMLLRGHEFFIKLDRDTAMHLSDQAVELAELIEELVRDDTLSQGLLRDVDSYRTTLALLQSAVSELNLAMAESILQYERILPPLHAGQAHTDDEIGRVSALLRSGDRHHEAKGLAILTGTIGLLLLVLGLRLRAMRRLQGRLFELAGAMRDVAEGRFERAGDVAHLQKSRDVALVAESLSTLAAQLQSQRDIIERERERAERSEDALRAQAQRVVNATHEMKASLSGIIGLVELIEQTGLTGEQVAYLEIVQKNSGALLGLMGELHEQARRDGGKVELEQREFSLGECLASALALFAPRAQEKGLRIEQHLGSNVPDRLIGDGPRFGQLINHVLGSAIVFTDTGLVTVHVNVAARMDKRVVLALAVQSVVRDVPVDKISEVLKPENRARVVSDSGKHLIGLAIAGELAELMGGQLWCEGEGSGEFRIRCKINMETRESGPGLAGKLRDMPQKLSTDLAERVPLRILLAEDTEVNQMLMTRLFAKMGYTLDVAKNGREAVALSRERPYDLILMDIQMPEMDGWEASSIILQESDHDRRPRIVAVTANASDENRQRCMSVGMDDFVTKPFTLQRMQAVVERWGSREH